MNRATLEHANEIIKRIEDLKNALASIHPKKGQVWNGKTCTWDNGEQMISKIRITSKTKINNQEKELLLTIDKGKVESMRNIPDRYQTALEYATRNFRDAIVSILEDAIAEMETEFECLAADSVTEVEFEEAEK